MKILRAILACSLFAAPVAAEQSYLPANFDETIRAGMEKWHAPGLGLAIVKDGKTILVKGYGLKSVAGTDPVNVDTVFQAGSTTKAFASMALAMLADEGKINWTDPVKKHLPELKIKDKYVEDNLTIAEALTHISGLAELSNLNIFITEDLVGAVDLLAETEQVNGFRTTWKYNNTTFGLAGMVVERVSGMPFHEFVTKRILKPLGMNNTVLLDAEVKASKNRAEAHHYHEGKQYAIDYPYLEFSQAAGMLNSTPADMDKWLKFLLARGVWNGEQLVSEKNLASVFKPRVFVSASGEYPALKAHKKNYLGYSLAWFNHTYRGHDVVMHTGSIAGMSAIAGLIPDENIGVYVFINSDHIEYRHALMYKVFDLLLGLPDEGVGEKVYDIYHPEKPKAPKQAAPKKVEAVAGKYVMAGTLPIEVTAVGDKWSLQYGVHAMPMVFSEKSGYRLLDKVLPFDKEGVPITFQVDADNNATSLQFWGMLFTKKTDD
ncbi:MAG: serine hydrolase [Kordiimonadaceae bacterium]|nr:serine hydrolase [Kordiimonadaceae bacterium]